MIKYSKNEIIIKEGQDLCFKKKAEGSIFQKLKGTERGRVDSDERTHKEIYLMTGGTVRSLHYQQ